jgi:hypothetical protein
MAELDFPADPSVGQKYTSPVGAVYEWTGYGWAIGFYSSASQTLGTLGGILDQCRTLLMDTDTLGGEYRYSNDSLVTNLNMGLWEMYRIRPDIFLELNFQVPQFVSALPDTPIEIEPQFVPALVYYVVGMAQLRDDEGTQDSRAGGFLQKFTAMLISVA